jgi:hypothetical protein
MTIRRSLMTQVSKAFDAAINYVSGLMACSTLSGLNHVSTGLCVATLASTNRWESGLI